MLFLTTLFRLFLDLLFPTSCLICGQEDSLLCQRCSSEVPPVLTRWCPACSQPVRLGHQFRNHGFTFDDLLCLAPYQKPWLARAIQNLKYHGHFTSAPLLARLMAQRFSFDPLTVPGSTLITNIPLHPRRQRERGFDQAQELASALSSALQLSYQSFLVRSRSTRSQTTLQVVDRQRNVQNIFSIKQRPSAPHSQRFFRSVGVDAPANFVLSGKTVILVDDVVTTGSTLSEASRVLKDFGAKRIVAVTIAYSIPERSTVFFDATTGS